tara:strand:- start:1114 stop:1872 length:759 start_codon:yes stop_codon:yes gene_type:complete
MSLLLDVLEKNALITAFVVVALVLWFSNLLAKKLFAGKIHGSAIALVVGLTLAYVGGLFTGGDKGLADITMFSGLGILGGAMFRDFAIVATAYGAELDALKRAGWIGSLSVLVGVVLSFFIGALVAIVAGFEDAVSVTTIGAGTATFIVGPVTGSALGADSSVIALSIAAGLVKSIVVMIGTPLVAKRIGLNDARSAMVFGGLMGTNSGVAAGLAATDPKLVPYGAMTATFYTGVGCLIVPSLLYFLVSLVL